jgi:RecB family exonuclease
MIKVKPLTEPNLFPNHIEYGNLLHKTLHSIQTDLKQTSINALDLTRIIREALHKQVQRYTHLSGRYEALEIECERSIQTFVKTHLALKHKGFCMVESEKQIHSHTLLEGVKVYGTIDRLDVLSPKENNKDNQLPQLPIEHTLFDYKTSNKTILNKKQSNPNLDAQLILYALLLNDNGYTTNNASYWRLHNDYSMNENTDIDFNKLNKETLLSIDSMNDTASHIKTTLQDHWNQLKTTHTGVVNPSKDHCQYCSYQGICRYSDITV